MYEYKSTVELEQMLDHANENERDDILDELARRGHPMFVD